MMRPLFNFTSREACFSLFAKSAQKLKQLLPPWRQSRSTFRPGKSALVEKCSMVGPGFARPIRRLQPRKKRGSSAACARSPGLCEIKQMVDLSCLLAHGACCLSPPPCYRSKKVGVRVFVSTGLFNYIAMQQRWCCFHAKSENRKTDHQKLIK